MTNSISAIGFSLDIDDDDDDILEECVVGLLDDLDVDLEGNLEWLWWKPRPNSARGVLRADVSAKATIKKFDKRNDDLTAKSISAATALKDSKKMRSVHASEPLSKRVKSSVDALDIIEQWQRGEDTSKSTSGIKRLTDKKKSKDESFGDFFQKIESDLKSVNWSDDEDEEEN